MKTAKFINKIEGSMGDARIYELSEPIFYDNEGAGTHFVYVSAATVEPSIWTMLASRMNVPKYNDGEETFIFPWDESSGEVISWSEMEGSTKGILDHKVALSNMGYELVED